MYIIFFIIYTEFPIIFHKNENQWIIVLWVEDEHGRQTQKFCGSSVNWGF